MPSCEGDWLGGDLKMLEAIVTSAIIFGVIVILGVDWIRYTIAEIRKVGR